MATPAVVVTTGGMPVTVATNGRGTPMTVVTNGYGIPVRVVASGGMPVVGIVTGPDITAPIITSSNTISQPENTALVHFLTANETVTWAKVGGADTAKFTLGSGATAGQLSLPAKDYEVPDDADANRTYIVQVQATDAAANPSAIQTITVTITNVAEIAAPVLTWTSGTTDTTPNFSVDLPAEALAGDVIYLEIADNISFTTTSTETLDAGEVAGDIVLMEQATPLADGTYYAKARLKRGANFGTYSNVETKTINTAVGAAYVYRGLSNIELSSAVHTATIDLGTASADRRVAIVVLAMNNTKTIVSFTVNGVALTQRAFDISFEGSALYDGLVTTGNGTNGGNNIVLTWSGNTFQPSQMFVWTMTGLTTGYVSSGAYAVGAGTSCTAAPGNILLHGQRMATTGNYATSSEAPFGVHSDGSTGTGMSAADWTIIGNWPTNTFLIRNNGAGGSNGAWGIYK